MSEHQLRAGLNMTLNMFSQILYEHVTPILEHRRSYLTSIAKQHLRLLAAMMRRNSQMRSRHYQEPETS